MKQIILISKHISMLKPACQPRSWRRCCGLSGIGVKGLLFPPGLQFRVAHCGDVTWNSWNAVDPHLSRRLCNSVRSVPRSLVKTSRIMPGIWPVNEHETFWMLSECNSRKQHEAWRGRPSDFLAKASRAVNVRMRGSPVVPAKLSELPAVFLWNEKLWT